MWNSLPRSVKTTDTLVAFRKQLKTHLFRLHYCLDDTELYSMTLLGFKLFDSELYFYTLIYCFIIIYLSVFIYFYLLTALILLIYLN